MTHILIAIEDITAKIEQSELELRACDAWEDTGFIEGEMSILKQVLKGTQISLDEKDIKKEAIKYCEGLKNSEYLYATQKVLIENSYKQALNDILL